MSFKKITRKRECIYSTILHLLEEKNLCRSGPAQFKPTLFKGQVCLWHPPTRAQKLEPDLEHQQGGEEILSPVGVTTTF